MELFPKTEVKTFGECSHCEFLELLGRGENTAGLCIQDESGERKFLVLTSNDQTLLYRLCPYPKGNEVLSYGTDWLLSPYGQIGTPEDAFREKGNILLTSQGTFMVCVESRHEMDEEIVCRFDQAEVFDLTARPPGGFGRRHWRIHYYDREQDARHKLAGKDAQEPD
ncbi:hypothetical protein PEL8287_03693 [Roseovarius litorisediminis]|uniref:Uncharacterized protein n=1 Tax=Roseovarius litorisediminis TaxID=1312363 RepID=A0A1Y5TL76_9RHOB|nr:hypothetical protein [Roseovarius litorisediminis]SLN66632.1 hypothetical protein PEL8287_03693 [Roseovarius litorisediminis]